MNVTELRKLAQDYREAAARVAEAKALQPDLEREAAKLCGELSDVGLEAFLLPTGAGKAFAPDTQRRLDALRVLRTKLDLLPGVVAKLEKRVRQIVEKIRSDVRAVRTEYIGKAGARKEALGAQLTTQLSEVCAGDPYRVQTAVQATVAVSDDDDWLRTFQCLDTRHDPADQAEHLAALIEAFEGKKRAP